jgi:hypothetical protein
MFSRRAVMMPVPAAMKHKGRLQLQGSGSSPIRFSMFFRRLGPFGSVAAHSRVPRFPPDYPDEIEGMPP